MPLLPRVVLERLPDRAREVVEYRKSGLSLNHIQGCPLGCSYCIRHTYGLWDNQRPVALTSDVDAVAELVGHRYFQPHVTPVQLFNRATDPFLPQVEPHTMAVLRDLDARGLTNHVLVITRHTVNQAHCAALNELTNLKVTLLFTWSGIDDTRIEPFPSHVAARSLTTAFEHADRYRAVFYWRPIVPGLNDTPDHLRHARRLAEHAHATVFTGLFYRDDIAAYYRANGVPQPYEGTARRKIVPAELERRILDAFPSGTVPLFRKTSCAVSYAHAMPDYNGHVGIRELCDICPAAQLARCLTARRLPTVEEVGRVASRLPESDDLEVVDIDDRRMLVNGLDEQPRYYLQHTLGYQVHDSRHPHRPGRHGRAEIGWSEGDPR
ncbi:MAG: radical SAM protein [Kineosporiaceae bacterium]|nr:radical SAM protein [Kineosporiaceae bacterium]